MRRAPSLALALIAMVALARHGIAQEPPAPKSPPAAEAEKKASTPSDELDKFLLERGVKLDRKTSQIHVGGWVNMQKGLIEVLACTPEGKTHESALALECVPSALNAAFLALGYKPGRPVTYGTERYELPKGDPVWITVEWKTVAGETKRVRAEELVFDRSTESAMATMAWIYVGSQMLAGPEQAKPTFAADAIKSLITTYHDPTSIIENPLDVGQDDTLFFANEKVLPPQQTPVTVTFWKSEPPRSAGG
jgi:hypothetical protein